MELTKKCHALKDIPARKIQILESFRTKNLKDLVGTLKRASDMHIVNDISEAQYGIGEITQLLPTGNVISWQRSHEPTDEVRQGFKFFNFSEKLIDY